MWDTLYYYTIHMVGSKPKQGYVIVLCTTSLLVPASLELGTVDLYVPVKALS